MKRVKQFWDYVDKSGECWLWTGTLNRDGYGLFKRQLAHRVAYIEANGDYPAGTVTDHLCRVRNCVRPSHLEAVTRGENVRRGLVPQMMTAKHSAVSNCPKGHPYAGENLYIEHPKDGHPRKRCRECRRESHRKVPSRVP